MLEIDGLTLDIDGVRRLHGVTLTAARGQITALVGESGAGKSLTAICVLGLEPARSQRGGRVRLDGRDLGGLDARAMREIRGREIGMVFQEPMTALDPMMSIGRQVAETARIHGASRGAASAAAAGALARVGLGAAAIDPSRRPHSLSGGQRQRAALAAALALRPRFLLADEPTAALDPVTREAMLDLFRGLVRDDGLGLLLVSHDLAMVAAVADSVFVMTEGRVVEQGPVGRVLGAPDHPYTRALVAASRSQPLGPPRAPSDASPILEARGLTRRRGRGRSAVTTLRSVDLAVAPGEIVALVGGSGAGKSTLMRLMLGLEPRQAGQARVGGLDLARLDRTGLDAARARVQPVFQDPAQTLDPRWSVERIVAEPLRLVPPSSPASRRARIVAAVERVGLDAAMLIRRPRSLSGGQRQRIAIARAIVIGPAALALDEATSALDLRTRAGVLALIADLRAAQGVGVLLISHDLAMVRALADRVVVLDRGIVVEQGPVAEVLSDPKHPATAALVAASYDLDTALRARTQV